MEEINKKEEYVELLKFVNRFFNNLRDNKLATKREFKTMKNQIYRVADRIEKKGVR